MEIFAIAVISLGAILFSLPNMFTANQLQNLPRWMQMRMPLGLDLQGGSYLLLQMNAGELRQDWLERSAATCARHCGRRRSAMRARPSNREEVRVTIRKPEDVENAFAKLRALARPISSNILRSSGVDLIVERGENNTIRLRPSEPAMNERIGSAIGSAIETIRRRVD